MSDVLATRSSRPLSANFPRNIVHLKRRSLLRGFHLEFSCRGEVTSATDPDRTCRGGGSGPAVAARWSSTFWAFLLLFPGSSRELPEQMYGQPQKHDDHQERDERRYQGQK